MGDLQKVSFWPYDIFGYLLPGALVLVAGVLTNQSAYDLWIGLHTPGASRSLSGLGAFALLVDLAAMYLAGHVIAAGSSLFLERLLLRLLLGYPTGHLFGTCQSAADAGKLMRLRLWFVDRIVPGYRRRYSDDFLALFEQAASTVLGAKLKDVHDIFWLSWHYVSLHHQAAYKRSSHLLDLYGLNRNAAFGFLLLACLPLLPGWSLSAGWTWSGACVGIAVILFSNYCKLFRRMNDEVYRGFVVRALSRDGQLTPAPQVGT